MSDQQLEVGDRKPGDGSESPTEPAATGLPNTSLISSSIPSDEQASAAAGVWKPNKELLNSLTELGFDKLLVEKALFYGSNDSLEQALNWILDFGQFDDGKPLNISQPQPAASAGASMISYKMVFVVNNTLKMGVGKIAAQVGHATLGLYRQMLGHPELAASLIQWDEQGETKVVLKADGGEAELVQLRDQASRCRSLQTYLVADAGRTQIASGSLTVLSLFGPSDRVDEVTGKLKLLQ